MKLSQLKQQIEELDASYFPRESKREKDKLLITHGPELLRRLLAAEEALEYERRLASKQVELLKVRMEEEPKAADFIRPLRLGILEGADYPARGVCFRVPCSVARSSGHELRDGG